MNKYFFYLLAITIFGISCSEEKKGDTPLTFNSDFNEGWKFRLIDSATADTNWKNVKIPHDWSVETSFDSINGEGATGYLLGGVGKYKKEFSLNLDKSQVAYIVFDGVYNNATVSLNGEELGFHPYGYSPFYFDISKQLQTSEAENILEVSVDRTRYADSRWYTGSGIYRNVELFVKDKLHIPIWGVFVSTPEVSSNSAKVSIAIDVKNNFLEEQKFDLATDIFNAKNEKLTAVSTTIIIAPESNQNVIQETNVANPVLWDVSSPELYKAVTTIKKEGEIVDKVETRFGIRNIRFDANEGFFLNGRNMKIKGVCLHHDGGLVGAAVPKGVWKRRLEKLKDVGCNAIRISHNPGSQEFLDLCDEMGFLVQDEFFDEWDNPKDKRKNMNEQSVDYITRGYTEHFQEWAEKDLKSTVLAHRNHPSIIQWSIGNEIEWTYPRNGDATGFFNNMHWGGNYFWSTPPNTPEQIREQLKLLPKEKYDIGKTAQKLANWTRELDTTRYIIANSILPSASHESGYTDALDMVGYSYRRVLYDYGHENYPEKPIMGTENLGQWHEWKAVMERPFISGTFLWTGIDYMGESNGGWPKKGTDSGLLDYAGFEKPAFHMFKSLWNEEPHVYIATQTKEKSIYKIDALGNPVEKKQGAWKQALWGWHNVNEHWNYSKNEIVIAEIYSNCEEVELFLNEKSLGKKKLTDFEDRIYKWSVPFSEGTLVAKGSKNGTLVETQLVTTSNAKRIKILTDKTTMDADGRDVAHITAQLVDANGNAVKTSNENIVFEVDGNAKILGVDTGSARNVQDYQSNTIMTDKGRCLLIVQTTSEKGTIQISATTDNLKSNTIKITSK